MSASVHDNWVYGHAVDYERCRLVLHTIYPHSRPPEHTDVVFEGVIVHHFEQQKAGSASAPANVLFEVEEADPLHVLGEYTGLLTRTKPYGWPVLKYETPEDLAVQLTATGARCFRVSGTCGLDGFVFAASMQLRGRATRAEVTA